MKKITIEEFQRRIKARFPKESFTIVHYDSLGKYAEIQCDECKNIIKISKASNFLAPTKANGCVNCHGLYKKREIKWNSIKLLYNVSENYEVKNSHRLYDFTCKKCGHVRHTTPRNLYNHLKCGCETGVLRNRTKQEFIDELNKYQNNEYELVSDYINQTTKVKLRHKKCGFIWEVRPGDVIHGRSKCPRCNKEMSRGEELVFNILKKYKVPFEREKHLEGSQQRFDFYLEIQNKKIAIEYNGKQHYEETNFFSSSLEMTQQRDIKKAKYCLEHNIDLIVLPYTLKQEEIEKILKEKIIDKFNDQIN